MIRHVTVLGAGTMGLAIARLFAAYPYNVTLYEPYRIEMARSVISQDKLQIVLTNDLEKAVAGSDLIIESVPEDLGLKRQLYGQLTAWISNETIIASNTSTFPLQQLSEALPYADRFVIMHFFNPAHVVPLVELVGLPGTRSGLVDALADMLRKMDKEPVTLNKDISGFIANRLQAAMLREACFLLEQGIASAEAIDAAVRSGPGLRWALRGPFAIADLGGLDIWAKVSDKLFPDLSNETNVPASLRQRIERGELGVKSGSGYYAYDDPAAAVQAMNIALRQLIHTHLMTREESDPHVE